MNKKFSTLVGCLAFGSAFSAAVAAGAVNSANGHYEFRKADVFAAPTVTETKTIDGQKWYQLKAYDPNTKQEGILVHTRNFETGEVYLRIIYTNEPCADQVPLNPSLWRIDYANEDGLSGGRFRFINKETGAYLMYDQTFAYNAKGETKNPTLSYTMVDGCVTRWAWYQGNTQDRNFKLLEPYAYFNNAKDSVMVMKANNEGFIHAYKDVDENVLANGKVISTLNALKVQPVLADAIVLDDYDFNSMIDYNKPSMDQYGSFKFYTTNGNLINPTEKAYVAHAMKDGMEYKAQYGSTEWQAVQKFWSNEMTAMGVDVTDNYIFLFEQIEKLKQQKKDIRQELKEDKTLLGEKETALQYWDNQKENWTLVEKERNADFTQAFERVEDVVAGVDENVAYWSAEGNFVLSDGWSDAKKVYDKAKKAYTKSLNKKDEYGCLDYEVIGKNAAAVYDASRVLLNQIDPSTPGSQGTFHTAKWYMDNDGRYHVIQLTEAELSVMSSYGEAAKELAKATVKVTNFTAHVERIQGRVDGSELELGKIKTELSAAQDKFNGYTDADKKTAYLMDPETKFMRLNYIEDKKDLSKNKSYLMVDTAYWQTTINPEDGDLDIINSIPKPKDPYAIEARYYFQLTYHPSQDSLVVEPLNASDISEKEAIDKEYFKDSYAAKRFVYSDDIDAKASQASNSWTSTNGKEIAVRLKELHTSNWCLTATYTDIEFPLNARIAFDNPYDYLKRATLETGLYFIQSTNNNGKYVVANLNGDLMYDVQNGDQEYNWMPSTMFVVEKKGCESGDLIEVRNREYGVDWTSAFEGQLYHELDENGEPTGNMFTINYQDYGWRPSPELDTESNRLYVKDTYKFIPVTNEYALTNEHHGYKFMDPETLPYSNYAFRYNRYNAEGEYMNVSKEDYLKVSTGADAYYELDTAFYVPAGEGVRTKIRVARQNFGYGAGVIDANSGKELPQLVRQAYTLKVKDNNLVDNDTTYVGVNNVFGEKDYFVARGLSDILDNNLAGMAMFYLKIDQFDAEGDTCYALINTLNKGYATHFYNGYQRANVLSTGHIGEEDLFNTQEDNIDAFALVANDRPLYREIDGNKVSFFRTVGGTDQKLFEDATNQTGASKVLEGFGYLGLAQEKMVTNGTDEWIVDPWTVSSARMPQYMFALELDSIADGLWCQTNTHGYFADSTAAKAADEDHFVFYNGYTEGRFLVNLADSVTAGSQAYHNPDLFTFNGRAVRLGFVEGVHMYISADEAKHINDFLNIGKTALEVKAGEYFFIAINGNKIADLKNDKGYLIPELLFNVKKLKKVDGKEVDNVSRANFADEAGHNDWTFSLRLLNDDSENFFIESNLDGVSEIGSMTGAWVKIDNNCPVLNYISGNHQTITAGNLTPDNVTDGQLFTLTASEGDATANEDIEVSAVTVIAGEGQVTIAGAAGKKVVVTNILGQTVATQVLTSDNAVIAAPQGVVVVAVEGEEAVKAIVK